MGKYLWFTPLILLFVAAGISALNRDASSNKAANPQLAEERLATYSNTEYKFAFEYPRRLNLTDNGQKVFGGAEDLLVKNQGVLVWLYIHINSNNIISLDYTDNAAIEAHNRGCNSEDAPCRLIPKCEETARSGSGYDYAAEGGFWEKTDQKTVSGRCVRMSVWLGFGHDIVPPGSMLTDDKIKDLATKGRIASDNLAAINIFNAISSSLRVE